MAQVVVVLSFYGDLPASPARAGEVKSRESAWVAADDPFEYLVLLGFENENAAQDDLRRLVERQDEQNAPFGTQPSAVTHVEIEHGHGTVLDGVPLGGLLAVARTLASPGYGHEAAERLSETVAQFAQFPGYCGHLEGVNEAVEEEAWSFVFATSQWSIPLPDEGETSVRLYRRVTRA